MAQPKARQSARQQAPFPAAASTSARTMRPPGPLPCRAERSMFCACARRRASGEALIRSPSARGGAAGCGGAAGVSRWSRGRRRRYVCLRFRRGFRRSSRRSVRLRSRGRVDALAFASDDRDRGTDLHAVRTFCDQNLGDLAFVDGFELHRRLVGLDLGKNVAGLHLVAFLHQPLGERALLHSGGKGGHLEFDWHRLVSVKGLAGSRANAACAVKSAPKP